MNNDDQLQLNATYFPVNHQWHEEILAAKTNAGSDGSLQRLFDDVHIKCATHVNKCDRHQQDDDRDENPVNGSFGPNDWNAACFWLTKKLFVLGCVGDSPPQVDSDIGVAEEGSRHVQVGPPGRIGWEFRLANQEFRCGRIDPNYARILVRYFNLQERRIVV